MNCRHISHFYPQVLIIFLVALSLLFAGGRVPDLSRPHRPKPTHRVVLEIQQKNASNHLKQSGDLVAVVPNAPRLTDPVTYHSASPVFSPQYASRLSFPNSGRSPPAALS
jgi:hypothetical protein